MSTGISKAKKIQDMERYFYEGHYSDIQMAKRLDVARETAYRYRKELIDEGVPFEQDSGGLWFIDKAKYVSSIRLNTHQALMLYLPAQKMARQTRVAQSHVADALGKLAHKLQKPMMERLVKSANRIMEQKDDPKLTKLMEKVTDAWVNQYKLEIEYQSTSSTKTVTHLFEPYLIEPSVWSDAIYVIGRSEKVNKILPLKITRMQRVSILPTSFETPSDFDEETLLKHAWGIWFSDNPGQTVKLKFQPGLPTQRLKESVWHPLETVTDTDEGGAIWQMEVAEWQEMLPWIRGWGSGVEVSEPQDLRAELRRETLRLMATYGLESSSLSKDDPDYHKKRAKSLFGG
jgi:predicted DNA-binding transcriptional regulator YafY